MTQTDVIRMIRGSQPIFTDEAINYWRHLSQDESPLRQYSDNDYQAFPISTQNYATFYNRKDVAAYMLFFNRYYIKKQ